MNEIIWLDYLNAFGSVATPILVILLTALGWKVRAEITRRHQLEDKLRDDRIEIYNFILEPFIIILTSDEAWKSNPKYKKKDKNTEATRKILSLEYRQKAFRLSLMGSDSVVESFNALFQNFYNNSNTDRDDIGGTMKLLGQFLLEIRRDMGNEDTNLNYISMLEWFITDIHGYDLTAE